MQIRTLTLLLTLVSTIATALVVWTIGEQKEALQTRSDSAQARRRIYLGAWQKLAVSEREKLADFGVDGSRASFWRTQNIEPLNFSRTTNQSNYFTDYSSAAEGEIVNPLIKSLLKEQRNLTVAGRFFADLFWACVSARPVVVLQYY